MDMRTKGALMESPPQGELTFKNSLQNIEILSGQAHRLNQCRWVNRGRRRERRDSLVAQNAGSSGVSGAT